MTIQIDSREKPKAIELIRAQFDAAGVKHFVSKLPCGDYMSLDNARLCIDRKQSLLEICSNVTQQHARFVREIKRAKDLGINLVFLCEHGYGIKTLEDIQGWDNPRRYINPKAVSGNTLYKILHTMQVRHDNISFRFCEKEETGQVIMEILGCCTKQTI